MNIPAGVLSNEIADTINKPSENALETDDFATDGLAQRNTVGWNAVLRPFAGDGNMRLKLLFANFAAVARDLRQLSDCALIVLYSEGY